MVIGDDFDLLLADRIAKIQAINQEYDLLNNSYISFSGGKDSLVLHYLIDIALPNNKIPRLFLNTGIEYKYIVKFVKELSNTDDRIIIYNSGVNIKDILNKYGYPFKSKKHSHILSLYQSNNDFKNSLTCRTYLGLDNRDIKADKCPKSLLYQFNTSFTLKISDLCCYKLKKEPASIWAKHNNKNIVITGMRSEEGGNRKNLGCIITDSKGKLKKFHPLIVVDNYFEELFIKHFNIKLCLLYYPPYNFKRTGCKGCPFALTLEEQLDKMYVYLPQEYKQCNIIWKPVYDEYKRLDYRLHKFSQLSLFD